MNLRRRAVLGALVACATLAPALHAADLTVLRTPGSAPGVSRLGARPAPSAVRLSSAAIQQQLQAKLDRWRAVPHFITAPHVDWSSHAARRRGWRAGGPKRLRTALVTQQADPLAPPDTIRILLLRVDFAHDRGGDASTGDGHFDLSTPGISAPPIDRPPHNRDFYQDHLTALGRYYDTQSYGRAVVIGDVWPRTENGAYSCNDMADLGPWEFSLSIYPKAVAMFQQMLVAADTQAVKRYGDPIPWHQYDRIVIVHAGSDLQSDVRQDSKEDIPSFTLGVADTDAVVTGDTLAAPIDRASFIPETINQDGYFGALNGVIAHECGHLMFGFVDLYDVETGNPRVGLWSLMDSGNLVGSIVALPDGSELFATGLLPPSIDPWQRAFTTDQLKFPEAAYGDTLSLRSGERHPDMPRVSLSSDEYLLLENRYLAPADSVQLDQADSSRVVLGPKKPDRHEYDALLPGGGVLVWHIDESVIPTHEFVFPCDTARANADCAFNTDPQRLAISVIEADGLGDLGDPDSPYIIGAPRDPWWKSNNPSLSDTTRPNLRPHIGTEPHIRIDFLSERDSTMDVSFFKTWQLPGWPIRAEFPPGGPQLLAIDVNGDRLPEVCWAGGPEGSPDSAAVFAVQSTGVGLFDSTGVFSRALDVRPDPVMAAIGGDELNSAPARFAVRTLPHGADLGSPGGRVWLLDEHGAAMPGWPVTLPAIATTPPVIATAFQDTFIYVGAADGRVYALLPNGTIAAASTPLQGSVLGRLAVSTEPPSNSTLGSYWAVAAGSAGGSACVFAHPVGGGLARRVPGAAPASVGRGGRGTPPSTMSPLPGWSNLRIQTNSPAFAPDFLWLDFGGAARVPGSCASGAPTLVVHASDRLYAFCYTGALIPGWGQTSGDTIAAGMAAADVDGDGFPEVITQSLSSHITYWNLDGHPSPGWPRAGTVEHFRSDSPPIAADLDGSGVSRAIAMNASGIVDAFDRSGKQPDGWPLATGLFATGAPLLADLNRDHFLELVAPDAYGHLYAYTLPTPDQVLANNAWPMLGGDPGRTSSLPAARTTTAPAPTAGPLVPGTLKAYPNPARRKPVNFAFKLTEPGSVEFRILDASGHEVASFSRAGLQSDNVAVWDPGSLPSGVYVARIRFTGASTTRTETVPLGLLR